MVDVNPTAPQGPALSATSDWPTIAKPANENPEPATPAAEATPEPKPAEATDTPETPEKPTTDAAPAEPEAKPAEAEPAKPDPAVTERALKGEITKANNRRAAAEKTAQEAQVRLDTALKALEKVTTAAKPETPPADPKPQRAAFDNPDAYDTALEGWAQRQGAEAGRLEAKKQFEDQQAEKEKTEKAQREEREQAAVVTAWQDRVKKTEADIPDLVEVVTASESPMSPVMQACLYRADNGPAIAYHLAKNPDDAARINSLPTQVEQVLAMGELAQQLKNARKPSASRTPPPIKPIGSKANAGPKDPNEMSGDEYFEHRMAQIRAAKQATH